MKAIRTLLWLSAASVSVPLDAGDLPAPPSAAGCWLQSGLAPQSSSEGGIWQDGVGSGFRSEAQTLSLEAGASAGFAILGGRLHHDLALVSVSYGHMLGRAVGEGHWYRGNWEGRAEVFTGAEFSPGLTWGVALAPHLRYDFATGTRWVPFLDGGAGVSATGERGPDLGGAFEFNLQSSAGVHWFIRDDLAVTAEARYLHVSSAGLYRPNQGLNTGGGLIGLTWFF